MAKKSKGRNYAYYAAYKGDRYIDGGDVHYLSDKFGIKTKTLHWLATNSARKRLEDTGFFLIRVEDDDEE